MIFLNDCNKNIRIINANEYLRTIQFANCLKSDEMNDSEFAEMMEKYSPKTYIPVISFPTCKNNENKKNTIISTVESVIEKQLTLASNVKMGVKYVVGEIIDNIIQHANSQRGYIFAQSNLKEDYIDICIADNGITLLGSYQTLNDNEIASDLEAILAANKGVSTKNLPDAENRGYGIITSKKMLIDGLRGSFIMMSGNALHLYNSDDKRFVETPLNIRWNGTIIALRIPYKNEKFNYINHIE